MRRVLARVRHYVTTRRVTVGIVVVMVVIGFGEWWVYDRYVPRRETFLEAIVEGDTADAARWLRSDPGIGERSIDTGWYPIAAAAESGQVDIVRLLLDHGVTTRLPGWAPMTILHAATDSTEITAEVVELLIDAGEDPAAIDDAGRTPLHWLAKTIAPERRLTFKVDSDTGTIAFRPPPDQDRLIAVATVLIKRGCPVDAADLDGESPFHRAVASHALELAEFFVQHGADPRRRSKFPIEGVLFSREEEEPTVMNPTPLHSAVWNRDPVQIIAFLLDHGARTDAVAELVQFGAERPERVTPLELAHRIDNDEAAASIESHLTHLPD